MNGARRNFLMAWLAGSSFQSPAKAQAESGQLGSLGGPGNPCTRALLVGVGQVAALPRRLWLRGPANDVLLMRQALQERGVDEADIICLGAAEPAGKPSPATHLASHARITAAMHTLLSRTRAGDQVVLHLAGHGVQVPQRPPLKPGTAPELDGLDEVFLCADTQAWDSNNGRLPGGLYDDDMDDWMGALVARGACVLAIFDTCHASGLHRDRRGLTRQRGIAAAELGVPSGPSTPPRQAAAAKPQDLQGRVLAFAARSHEGTPEEWLPKRSPQAQVHGVFTYAVVQALRNGVADAAALRRSVAGQYLSAGRESPTPSVLGGGALLPGILPRTQAN